MEDVGQGGHDGGGGGPPQLTVELGLNEMPTVLPLEVRVAVPDKLPVPLKGALKVPDTVGLQAVLLEGVKENDELARVVGVPLPLGVKLMV
jgi:hypothetical protein